MWRNWVAKGGVGCQIERESEGIDVQLQNEFNFQGNGAETGYSQWVVVRGMAAETAAQKLNLPVGHETEVWLRGGIRLRGKLRLRNDFLFVEESQIKNLALVLDGVSFTYAEMESCVRVDY
jgi:hypothetical protein